MARRSATPRRLSTKSKANAFTKQILDDFEDEVEAQFNGFIAAVVSDLASKKVSPVLTGFFASSWKAGKSIINEEDERERFTPWSSIKTIGTSKGIKLAPGQKPYIKQRFAVPKTFKLNETVYIGNSTKYAPQALFSPKSKVFAYLAGGSGRFDEGLSQKIDRFFTDKRPNISVGGDYIGSNVKDVQTQYQNL